MPTGEESVKNVCFGELDEVKVKNALVGRTQKPRYLEVWACNAFDKWRLCNEYNIDKSIGDIPEEVDIRGLVDLLFKFTLQVQNPMGHCTFLHCTICTLSSLFDY